jgi:D-alanine-D-alanine ligase
VAKHLFAEHGIPTPAWVTLTADAFKEMGAATALDLVPSRSAASRLSSSPPSRAPRSAWRASRRRGAARGAPDGPLVRGGGGPDGEPMVLPPVEIVAKSGLFDFSAMYTAGETDYYVPARLAAEVSEEVVRLARAVHELLGCRDVSRVDMVVGGDGIPYVLESNTSPGMTDISLLPMAARAADMTFQDVVERIVQAALARRA